MFIVWMDLFGPGMTDAQKIQLLKGLTVDGAADRLQALSSMTFDGFTDARFKKNVFSILLDEYLHTPRDSFNAPARQAALTALLRNMRLVPFSQKELVTLASTLMTAVWLVPSGRIEAARGGENDAKCRRLALEALATLLDIKLPVAVDRLEVRFAELPFGSQLIGTETGKGAKGAWTEAANTPSTVLLDEALFVVASQVAANDVDRMVREGAFRLLSRLARHEGGANVNTCLLLQTMKKDCITNGSPNMRLMPLLACGAIAHGIEDQFAEIRLAALQCLCDLVLSPRKPKDHKYDHRLVAAVVRALLDAVLDESELLRVAALQILHAVLRATEKSRHGCVFSVPLDEGLDVLLGLLDDGNEAVRIWAVACLGHVAVTMKDGPGAQSKGETGYDASHGSAEGHIVPFSLALETAARILKCFESALLKLAPTPNVEAEILKVLRTLGHNHSALVRACPVALSHLLQTADVSRFKGLLGPVGPELFHLRLAFLLGVADGPEQKSMVKNAQTGIDAENSRTLIRTAIEPWLGRLLVKLPLPQDAPNPSATDSFLQSLQNSKPEHLNSLKFRTLVQKKEAREHNVSYRLATDVLLLPSTGDTIYFHNGSVLVPPFSQVGSLDQSESLNWFQSLNLSSLAAIVPVGSSIQCTTCPAPSDLPYPCIDLPRRISIILRGFRVIGNPSAVCMELVVRFALSSQTSSEYRQPITKITPVGVDDSEWIMQATLNPSTVLESGNEDIFITDMELTIESLDKSSEGTSRSFTLLKEPIKYILH